MGKTKQLINNKWMSTVASIWIQCTSGSLYTFSVYSSILKSSQQYDQSTLDTISVFKDIGANLGVLSGLLYAYAAGKRHLGPWLVHLVGGVMCFTGYFLMWAAVTGVIPRPSVPLMCFFMFLTANSQPFFNTSDVVTSVRNFPSYSGTAVGIMKGFIGLSGAILIQTYQTILADRPDSYILMLAILTGILPILLMWFVRVYDTKEKGEKKNLNHLSVIALVIAAYLMGTIILKNVVPFSLSARIVSLVVLMILVVSPLNIAFRAHRNEVDGSSVNKNDLLEDIKSYAKEHPFGYCPLPSDDDNQSTKTDVKIDLQYDGNLNLLQAVGTLNFWLLFLAMACGMGSGLATVNNVSQIGGSLGYKSSETGTLVSLWSIWNFLGRFGAGFVSDYFLHTKGFARPLFMAITLATMSIGHVLIAFGFPGALYIGSVLVGVCYGSQWSLMPTITSEIYGVLHMGTIFNTISIASPMGSYIFSVRVVGYLYDKQASGKGNLCTGTHCFMLSFLIMASATLLGSLVALVLFYRTRRFYNQVIVRRRIEASA